MKSDKFSRREKYLRSKYGIGIVDYRRLLRSQDNACAICKRHKSTFSYSLHVDHNHKTGKNRGLLCYYCNKFRVGRSTLESAKLVYEYLLKHES